MTIQYHTNIALGALRNWFRAQLYDSMIIGGLWLVALLWLGVPWAPFWAILAAIFQFIPHFGPILSLLGPAVAMAFSGMPLDRWLWFLGVYAGIAVVDGLLLQPYLMRRQNRVPFWASLLCPILLGMIFPFWGVLLAPPLLAIIYAYRDKPQREKPKGEQQFSAGGNGIVLPPDGRGGA